MLSIKLSNHLSTNISGNLINVIDVEGLLRKITGIPNVPMFIKADNTENVLLKFLESG